MTPPGLRASCALFVLAAAAPRPARACATAPPAGLAVTVAQESAVVVWDPAQRTEHFVRRAVFRAQSDHFGFLVPTPTRPSLHEESDAVLDRLEQIILPEIRYEDAWSGVDPTPLSLGLVFSTRSSSSPAGLPAVRVLEQTRVGPFEAAVLAADDAGALEAWLREHGYDERPALRAWLEPYVSKKWVVTAFRVADPDRDGGAGATAPSGLVAPRSLGSATVRMSFVTDRPFFPYREPADQRDAASNAMSPSRALRVFYVGPSRASATIGDGKTPFPGRVSWAGPLDPTRAALPVAAPAGAWLTAFEDDASPRPGVDDLWFDPSKETKDGGIVRPPPVVVRRPRAFPLPIDLVLFTAGLVVVARRSAVRRRRRAEARARQDEGR